MSNYRLGDDRLCDNRLSHNWSDTLDERLHWSRPGHTVGEGSSHGGSILRNI